MNATTIASRSSAAIVALVAGYSSFSHIAHVALRYGERPEVAHALPFAVDGLLVVATTAMLEDKRLRRPVRWSARVAFAFGVTASLAANVASARPDIGARIVAAVPAIALLLAVEVLSRSGRADTSVNPTADAAPDHSDADTGYTDDELVASVAELARETVAAPDTEPGAAMAATATTGQPRVAADGPLSGRSRTTTTLPNADVAAHVAILAMSDPHIKAAAVAAQLGVSERTARRYLAAVRTSRTTRM